MQKSTEHILGCVLCSPGCFSMFRGAALMDKNVMRKYTTQSTEARHYVQYDQGSDSWGHQSGGEIYFSSNFTLDVTLFEEPLQQFFHFPFHLITLW